MNNFLFKVVAAVVIAPIVIIAGQKSDQKALDLYQITDMQAPVATSCRAAMSRYEIKFAGGAKKNKACACIAKHAATQVAPDEFKSYSAMLNVKLEASKAMLKGKEATESLQFYTSYLEKIETIQKDYKLSDKRLEAILDGTSEAVSVCGQSKSHQGDALAQIMATPNYRVGVRYKKVKNAELHKTNERPKLRRIATKPSTSKP